MVSVTHLDSFLITLNPHTLMKVEAAVRLQISEFQLVPLNHHQMICL